MLLTAKSVRGPEAVAIGLASRLVPDGKARVEAEALAQAICAFPHIAMGSDRRSTYEQDGAALQQALIREEQLAGEAKRLEAQAGASRFAAGAGRHGAVD